MRQKLTINIENSQVLSCLVEGPVCNKEILIITLENIVKELKGEGENTDV